MSQIWLSELTKYRLIAVIRDQDLQLGEHKAIALAEAGVKFIEITWNSEKPDKLISLLRQKLPDCYIGAGTIMNQSQLLQAINSGSQFIFSPYFCQELLTFSHQQQIPFIPGATTPTEIIKAYQAGALAVKVFPIQPLGGIAYLKSIKAPLSDIPLIPTGGIKLEQSSQYIHSGAIAVGLASDLFPEDLIKAKQWHLITQRLAKIQQLLIL